MIYTEKKLKILAFTMVVQLFSMVLVAQNTAAIRTVDSVKLQKETIKIDVVNLSTLKEKLQKATQSKDTLKIANAYDAYSEFHLKSLNELCLTYSDSVLFITKDLKDNEKFPALGYNQKGRFYYRVGKYNLALDNYIKALNAAKENTLLHATANFNIGLIKNTIKRPEEAKKIFKQYVRFLEMNQQKELARNYNLALFALSHSLTYTGQLDSAAYYIDKGMKNCIYTKDTNSYSFFVLNSGINSFYRKDYKMALDSLQKAKDLFVKNNDPTSLAFAHLYLGKSNLAMNTYSIKHFISVDSILEITKDVMPELLETYDDLKKYYRSKGDNEKLLHYMEQELKFRDISKASYEDLVKNIVTNYDNKILEKERDQIIKTIKKKDESIIIVLLSLLLAFAVAIYYFFRKQVIHKKRFHKLLTAQQEKQSKKVAAKKEEVAIIENNLKELPEDLVNDILVKLEKFEATDKFVKKRYTLPQLARELNTNGTYLSKVINETKQVNFANYLNQLRIEYSIERITTDSRFREYTIKAIAEESGFKTQQSFSAAFYKKTGIKPSFFIRQLKSKIKNQSN